jgi:amidase
MTSIAHGGDGTGSLRYPAAACGVVTLKPSRGRIPHVTPAEQPDDIGVWTEFVLSRSVRDLAGVLDVIGPLPAGERWHAPPPRAPYVDDIARPQSGSRIGLLLRDVMAGIPTDITSVNAVRDAGELLARAGHHVEESHPPALDGLLVRLAAAIATWGAVARAAQLRWLSRAAARELTRDDLDEEHFAATAAASQISEAQLRDATETIENEVRPVQDWFADHDVLITPVLRQPAWPLGQRGGAMDAGVFPATFSFTGQPAGVVPVAWTDDGLPVGVQIIAAYGRDDVVLNVMAQLEAARPWAQRWPDVAGV